MQPTAKYPKQRNEASKNNT